MTKTKKKKYSLAKLLTSVVMAMLLSIGFAQPAFAASGPNGSIEGDAEHPAEAAITKVLEIPTGTNVPAASFEFLVAPFDVDGSSASADLATAPVVGNGGKVTIDLSTDAEQAIEGGITKVYKESDSLFVGITWPHTGVYTYKVTEVPDTYNCSTSIPIEEMTYSEGEYLISVYVDRADDGTLYARYIGTVVVTPGAPGQAGNDKVDPTPGGDPSVATEYSQMIFTNSYLKINAPDKPNPITDGVLIISKTVKQEGLADPDQYFDFDVTITSPETIADSNRVYKAYVVDANGIVKTIPAGQAPAGSIKSDSTNDYIEFASGATLPIQLKDGQYLSFIDLPVGSGFDVTEIDPRNYTASYVVTVNGLAKETATAGSVGASLGFSKPFSIGEAANSAAFNNSYREVTPTGIAVDNLPYIVIIALALSSLVGFVVFRARKKAKSHA